MPQIVVETFIQAPIEKCFDLARDIGLHCETAAHTREKAVAGVTSGLINLGQSVTFEGVHFGVRQRLTAKIIEFEKPHRFVDEMTQGIFASMRHVHQFEAQDGGTLMRDVVTWKSPLGALGTLADVLFLKRYLRRFLVRRGLHLKRVAESKF